MKTVDEIKKGLFCCWEDGCATCPYDDDCTMEANFEQLAKDSLDYINHLESRLSQAERDAKELADNLDCSACTWCEYYHYSHENEACKECRTYNEGFKLRGVCEENTKEDVQ